MANTEAKANGAALLPKRTKRRGLRDDSRSDDSETFTTDENGAVTMETKEVETPPVEPVQETKTPAPVSAPIPVAPSVGPAWFRRIEQPKIRARDAKDGWEEGRSALLFTAEANNWEPVSILCTDVRIWGQLGEALICRSKDPVIIRMPDGEKWKAAPGTTFAMLAVNELMHILEKMETNPESVVEADVYPIAERRMESGLWTVHYRVLCRIVPGLSRKEAWRG